MLQEVLRVSDAKRAGEAGARAISVSNRSGNDLDGTRPRSGALPAIAGAAGDQVEIVLDGASAAAVVKAVALGPGAAMIGRFPSTRPVICRYLSFLASGFPRCGRRLVTWRSPPAGLPVLRAGWPAPPR